MVKEGPCFNCGVTYTPLWRNGPPEKPVLCNACGTRWRTKGTLDNYTPLHSHAFYSLEEGPVRSNILDFHIPSKKRSETRRRSLSLVEKLRRDLLKIKRQQYKSFFLSGSSEDEHQDELIFERKDQAYSDDEIGLGIVLLNPPAVSFNEEHSKVASSHHMIENKSSNNESFKPGYGKPSFASHVAGGMNSKTGRGFENPQDEMDMQLLRSSSGRSSSFCQSMSSSSTVLGSVGGVKVEQEANNVDGENYPLMMFQYPSSSRGYHLS